MCAPGVKNADIATPLIHHPYTLTHGGNVPAITQPQLIGYIGRYADRNLRKGSNRSPYRIILFPDR